LISHKHFAAAKARHGRPQPAPAPLLQRRVRLLLSQKQPEDIEMVAVDQPEETYESEEVDQLEEDSDEFIAVSHIMLSYFIFSLSS
jgi:hypothetical protein